MSDQTTEINWRNLLMLAALSVMILAFLYWTVTAETMIDRAKLVLSLIMLAASAVGLYVVIRQGRISEKLIQLETSADRVRDDAMFELTAVRSRLSAIRERLARSRRPEQSVVTRQLVEQAGSALMLVLNKERSLLTWGFWAAKLGKSALDYFKSTGKN